MAPSGRGAEVMVRSGAAVDGSLTWIVQRMVGERGVCAEWFGRDSVLLMDNGTLS